MEDIIDIIVTETTNLIQITSSGSDEIIDVNIIDNREDIVLNVTPTVVEININSLIGNFGVNWGQITGTLSNQTDLYTTLGLKADLVGGLVPSSQLPSYVDDVVEVANYAALPVTGESGKIYVTIDTNYIYRWTGSVYVEIKDSSAVWGAITGTLSNQTDLQNALNAKEPTVNAGTTLQYYRGDKTFQTLNTSIVSELTNLYYTEARVNANTNVAANTAARHNAVTIGTANGLSLSTQVLSLGLSSSIANGALSSTDWTTFNAKQAALSGTGFVKIVGTTISYDNSTYYLASNPSAFIALTALSAGAGISYNNTTGVITSSITQYTDALARAAHSLTVTGASGASTYNNTTGVLNVPTYTLSGLGGQPLATNLTSLSGLTYASASFVKMTAAGTFALDTSVYYLASNPSGFTSNVGTVTSVGLSSATSGVTIGATPITTSGTVTLAIATASGSGQGLLSSTDWTTFNNKAPSVAGGYLPLSGGTLTGALSGTSGTFSGNVSTSNQLRLEPSANATLVIGSRSSQTDFQLYNTGNIFRIYNGTNDALSIATGAGAATFSSSVTAVSGTFSGNVSAGSVSATNGYRLKVEGLARLEGANTVLNYGELDVNNVYFQALNAASNVSKGFVFYGTSPYMIITSSGNLGIGTTSPSGASGLALAINGGANQTRIALKNSTTGDAAGNGFQILLDAGSLDAAIENRENGHLRFATGGAERMRITSAGNVGIGTTAPNKKVEISTANAVNDGIRITYNNVTSEGLDITYLNSGATTINFDSIYNSNSAIMQFRMKTNGAALTALAILGNGNVGIGTTSPTFATGAGLAVFAPSQDARFALKNTASGDTATDGFQLVLTTALEAVLENRENGSMRFLTNATEAMRITAAGNVLIGKTSGNSKFAIVGLPTSSVGLAAGDVYVTAGALMIV